MKAKILSTKYEILNNTKAQMTKIQNKTSFGIWIWNLEIKAVEMPKSERKIKTKQPPNI